MDANERLEDSEYTSVGQPVYAGRERHTIWQGVLEWIEKPKTANDAQKNTRHVPCQVSAHSKDGEPELKADSWPQKLIMQLMPKQLIGNIGGVFLKNSKSVLFHSQPCEALESLTKLMSSGFAGCVHFTSLCDIKVLILLYTAEKRAYLGFIPNDQVAFVDRLRKVIEHQKSNQALSRQGQICSTLANMDANEGLEDSESTSVGQPVYAGRERHTIWQGVLEWIEKSKTANDAQKNTRHVPCQVSAHSKDGEPELKADSWPQKLIMQLMPKQLIGNIGGVFLKNSKSVLFHSQPCEALESLTKLMSSGFAGCVHFTSPCDIKVLILLYTAEKRAYLGFIPNDQVAFVDRLCKVIEYQKSNQALSRQSQAELYLVKATETAFKSGGRVPKLWVYKQ